MNFSTKEAFRSSFQVFGRNVGNALIVSVIAMVFIFMLVLLALMNYIGMRLIVGIIFTLPISVLVMTHIYVQLSEQKENCQKKALEIEYETC